MIDIAPHASTADRDSASRGINSCVFNRREIDYQAVIANSQTARVVTPAADGNKQIGFTREIYAADDVGNTSTPRDQPPFLMYHAVVNLAGFIVIGVARLDQFASEASF